MKDAWYQISKGETPEKFVKSIECEDYNTPRTVYVEYPDGRCGTRTEPTGDLHYLTDYVLCLWCGQYVLDFRRKFDSKDEWIWNKLEGCDVEYWRSLPEAPNDFTMKINKN